jgi:hypothetical protein
MANTLPRRNFDLKIFETIFRHPLPLQRESSLFLIASVLDVLMTCMLLEDLTGVTGRTIFYESNPVAGYFFQHWHLAGIVYFKFAMVGFIEVIAHVIALKNVPVGRRLLDFGTLVVSLVVIYSMYLLMSHR